MRKTLVISLGLIILLSAQSCKKKGCTNEKASNYSEEAKKDDGSCSFDTLYKVPTKYEFTREGNNTVSFSGQTQRLDMLSEITIYLKTANTAGTILSYDDLVKMYSNDNFTWVDADNLGLIGSSKQLMNKTAYAINGGSADQAVQALILSYFDSITTISATTITNTENGESGVSGIWPNDGVKGPYLMDGTGKEYTQLIEKGLMSAVFMNQITVNYLGGISGDNNTTIVDEAAGKYYTEMEHHWDEAYGYFSSSINNPNDDGIRFWSKYAKGRETIISSATKIYNAFINGRTAIINLDYTLRDAQVKIIRDEIEKVAAGTAIHYLNSAKSNMTSSTARNHSLSEAMAFLNGLKYGYNAINSKGMTSIEIDLALSYFTTDFNTISITDLNTAIDYIASKTGLESVKSNL